MISSSTQPVLDDCRTETRQRLLRVREQLQRLCDSLDAEIRRLDSHSQPPPAAPLFTASAQLRHAPVPKAVSQPAQPPQAPTASEDWETLIISPTPTQAIEPALEQETLHELNAALNLAFREITNRAAA